MRGFQADMQAHNTPKYTHTLAAPENVLSPLTIASHPGIGFISEHTGQSLCTTSSFGDLSSPPRVAHDRIPRSASRDRLIGVDSYTSGELANSLGEAIVWNLA